MESAGSLTSVNVSIAISMQIRRQLITTCDVELIKRGFFVRMRFLDPASIRAIRLVLVTFNVNNKNLY